MTGGGEEGVGIEGDGSWGGFTTSETHPLASPAPLRAIRLRDVNFTVFMNIYINLHFTAASVATQRGRDRGIG